MGDMKIRAFDAVKETPAKSVGQSGRGRACGETVENTESPCGAGTGQARARPAAKRENRHPLWQAGTGTLPRSDLSVSSGPSCHGCHHPFFFVCPVRPQNRQHRHADWGVPNLPAELPEHPKYLLTCFANRKVGLACVCMCARMWMVGGLGKMNGDGPTLCPDRHVRMSREVLGLKSEPR